MLFLGLLTNNLHRPRTGEEARLVAAKDEVLHDLQKRPPVRREASIAIDQCVERKSNRLQIAQHMQVSVCAHS